MAPHFNPSEPQQGPNLMATSTDVPQDPTVILYWTPVEEAVGYNLYRQIADENAPPASPVIVNTSGPIRPAQTCPEFTSIISEDSPEWEMVRSAIGAIAHAKRVETAKQGAPAREMLRPSRLASSAIREERVIVKRSLQYRLEQKRTHPCTAIERGLTPDEVMLLNYMAKNNLKIAFAMGLAFRDTGVTKGARYIYSLKAILKDGSETETTAAVSITAGIIQLPDPPSGISATPGDSKVLLTWNRAAHAFGYVVGRSQAPGGVFERIHQGMISFDVTTDLEGNPLPAPVPGFVDFMYWDEHGLPTSHSVDGNEISGPANGLQYFYQVASCDILGRPGAFSSGVFNAIPHDLTPPMAPSEVSVDYSQSPEEGLALSWRKVTYDALGHKELDQIQTYIIYRAETLDELADPAGLGAFEIHRVSSNPQDPGTMDLSWTDIDPVLFPQYGEKPFYYRIRCVDGANNQSAPSAIVSGKVPDTTPPGATAVTEAKGAPDSITVFWDPNTEPDLEGYQIYRSICNRGTVYTRDRKESEQKSDLCDFILVGEVYREGAEKQYEENRVISFKDTSVPPDSPVCYAYWVRAFDYAGNLYEGQRGCPIDRSEYACGRLTERTPPPVPVITGLRADHRSILVSWAASPIQDLHAFHIYRSRDENEAGDLIGCVLRDGTIWSGPWTGIKPSCDDIPATPDPHAIMGSFSDRDVDPNQVYWYRVSALDWLGNESNGAAIKEIPAVSTFSYTRELPPVPTIRGFSVTEEACGLTIRWDPLPDGKTIDRFLVFRSPSQLGPYLQVSSWVNQNEFTDPFAPRMGEVWYRVQSVDPQGRVSPPSEAVQYQPRELPPWHPPKRRPGRGVLGGG